MVGVMLGACLGGAIHPEMGRRNGALCTHPDFPMRLSHEPGLWIYYKYQYGDVRATLSWHVRAVVRPWHTTDQNALQFRHWAPLGALILRADRHRG